MRLLFIARACAIALAPKSEHLLLARCNDSNAQDSERRYFDKASQPLKAISLQLRSNTFNVLFSNRCSVMTYIPSSLS